MCPMSMSEHRLDQVSQPGIELTSDHHVVDDDLEGPGCSQSHDTLDQHRKKDDRQAAPVRAKQFADEAHHTPALFAIYLLRGLDHCKYPLLLVCERDTTLNGIPPFCCDRCWAHGPALKGKGFTGGENTKRSALLQPCRTG